MCDQVGQTASGPYTPFVVAGVHYVSPGTPVREDGTQAYPSVCRAAIVTKVGPFIEPSGGHVASLCVLNPRGMFFNGDIEYSWTAQPGAWHWPGDSCLPDGPDQAAACQALLVSSRL